MDKQILKPNLVEGTKVRITLERLYTQEEIKEGCTNEVNGATGTLITRDEKWGQVKLDKPIIINGDVVETYHESLNNIDAL